jgi:acyl-CoA reductase-like NAD-dependent aldehyde dehydrogenase
MKIVNPATGATLADVAIDTPGSIRNKVAAGRAAQAAWARTPLAARLGAIGRFREQLVARHDALALTLTREVGKPIRQARNELAGVLARIDFFTAETAAALRAETVHTDGAQQLREEITHEPLGVVANISAWNYPYFVGANVFVPALLAGNAVVYKPSEYATLSGVAIGEMMWAAGVPPEMFAVVVGNGDAGAALLRQDVDGVFFTGSYATGAKIAAVGGKRMIKVQLELGGKDPVYVCDDVDPASTAAAVADGAFYNTGQSCCAVERIYVHEAVYDAFVDAFVKEVRGFRQGDPEDEATYIGPVTRREQLDVLRRQVADATRRGARVLTGGKWIRRRGNWFEPTVLVDVDHDMLVMREESFGPIIGIQKVSGDDDAVAKMNDTEYGLTAGVYTHDEARARGILAAMRTGTVYWNCCDRVSPRLPWSGLGHSGIGLTLSRYGIQTFTRPKAWHMKEG